LTIYQNQNLAHLPVRTFQVQVAAGSGNLPLVQAVRSEDPTAHEYTAYII